MFSFFLTCTKVYCSIKNKKPGCDYIVNTTQYWQFQLDLQQLGFDVTCYADLVHIYILVRLLFAYSPAENDYVQVLSDKRYTKVLETCL